MTVSPYSRRKARSLRWYLAILLGLLGLLVAALLVVASLQVQASNRQADAENQHVASYLLADGLRQSSDDLTNMARLYVATRNSEYRDHYREILAIRAGEAPRPLDYNETFWDRVLAEGSGFIRYGPPRSLEDQMRAANFSADEFEALRTALETSNRLAQLENAVMGQVPTASPAEAPRLLSRLVDQNYLTDKGLIMAAIQRFVDLVEQRAQAEVQAAQADSNGLLKLEVAIIAAIVLVGCAALLVLSRVALRPLASLMGATRTIADGDYGERVELRAVSELERVAGAFNEMAGAVEADVVARRAAEQEAVEAREVAEHASRAKTTFLAAMSHEIRTPMIGVTGMLEVLARTELTPQQRQMLGTAESSAVALLQIIGDILDFSKIEADRLELAPATISVRSIVKSAIDTFVHTASAKGLLLTSSMDETLAPAHVGDPLRLRQILSNLLSNAIKFTDVGGIEVALKVLEASSGAQTVGITVTDTGVGVDRESQARLFQDFAQADAATSRKYGGTGLGLVICRRLAGLMGGDLSLESVPGRGTTVRLTITLPVGEPAELVEERTGASSVPAMSRPKPSREEALQEGSLLLLAEDHPVNRTVLGHQLDLIGFRVDFAVDGQEAYERWVRGGYALVLTDLNMPRMDGFELARRMRAREAEAGDMRTPIIALSANVMQGEAERCRSAGMDDFLPKPTTMPVLAGRLRQWLPQLRWAAAVAPSAVQVQDEDSLDSAVLDELTGGDAELAESLLADFVATCQADVAALHQAIEVRDAEAARRQAHRIKGAARTVGAARLALLAQRIEATSGEAVSHWEERATSAGQLGRELERVRAGRGQMTE